MAEGGITDIFIANEIVGEAKLDRIRALNRRINIAFGIDSIEQVKAIERVLKGKKNRPRF